MTQTDPNHKRIVILGAGFAGIELAQKLQDQLCEVVLVDRNNYFTFQPLLYQVAIGGLEPNSIAYPLRRLFRKAGNVRLLMAEVERFDPARRRVTTSSGELTYDYLVLATGSRSQFFGLDRSKLLPLKTVPTALGMRNHILREFEKTASALDGRETDGNLNFVVVGGGPTGVELAGALGEMKKFVLPKDFPELDLSRMCIHLVEGLERLLPAMSETSSRNARAQLEELDVHIHLETMIEEYDGASVELNDNTIPTRNLIWTAGVEAVAPPGAEAAEQVAGGRLLVDTYNRVEPYDDIFAIGDLAAIVSEERPKGHPMLAPVAIQQGRRLGDNLLHELKGEKMQPFEYNDRGTMATIGRNRAVADVGDTHLKGFPAWLAWMFIHLLYLVGFRNKAVVLFNWVINYFTYDKALRLILEKEVEPEVEKV